MPRCPACARLLPARHRRSSTGSHCTLTRVQRGEFVYFVSHSQNKVCGVPVRLQVNSTGISSSIPAAAAMAALLDLLTPVEPQQIGLTRLDRAKRDVRPGELRQLQQLQQSVAPVQRRAGHHPQALDSLVNAAAFWWYWSRQRGAGQRVDGLGTDPALAAMQLAGLSTPTQSYPQVRQAARPDPACWPVPPPRHGWRH